MLKAIQKQIGLLFGRALRETGQAVYIKGSKMTNDVAYLERYSRHRKLLPLNELWPSHGSSFIAPSASLQGEVQLGHNSAVLYNVMIRADSHAIRISDNVVIGENSVLQTVNDLPKDVPASVNIAENVLVGDNCTLISCCIDSNVTLGSGSVVQQGAKVERGAVLLPGSVVAPGATIPAYTVWGGSPAKYLRDVTLEDQTTYEALRDVEFKAANSQQEILKSLGH